MLTATLRDVRDIEATAQALFSTSGGPTEIHLPLGLDRDGFLEFCERHPDLFTELEADGTVTIMSPLVHISSEHEGEAFAQLIIWHKSTGKIGKVFNNSAGYTLPTGAVKAPDASWVSPERLLKIQDGELNRFARMVPDFVIEVWSKSDSLTKVKAEMTDTWMAAGVRLGWLLDPRHSKVYVYRPGAEIEVVADFTGTLSADEVVPGFVMDLSEFA